MDFPLLDLMDERACYARLVGLLQGPPERRFDDTLADAQRAMAAAREEAEAMRVLRRMKADAALLIALSLVAADAAYQLLSRECRSC